MQFSLFRLLTLGALGCGLVSCQGAGHSEPLSVGAAMPLTERPAPTAIAPLAVSQPTLTVYRASPDCTTLIAQEVSVPEVTLETAVGAAIAQFNRADFAIAGYRVQADPNTSTITVELRIATAQARARSWSSLSTCEELALFGGIRATLLNHPQGQGKTVEFRMVEPQVAPSRTTR